MHHWNAVVRLTASILLLASITTGASAAKKPKSGPYDPHIDPANFQSRVDHPYFPLVPGTKLVYRETLGGETSINEMTVLPETRQVHGVACTVVHDVVKQGESIKEDTMDWYAQDKQGNVWYFGEDTKEYFPHGRVSTEGSWESGVKGGLAGIVMPAEPTPAAPYRQEYGKGVAEDMGQVVATGEKVTVPYAAFTECVKTKEWSLLEAGHEWKWYAKGIGFVHSISSSKEDVVLLSVSHP